MADRQIIHVDMDAFYAAVEQRDNPELRGKPVIIGGADPLRRGVVSTASYEARKFGVHSAMPLREAYRRCPDGVYLPVRMGKYKRVSEQIFSIFLEYTPLVETIALDEAFLDVSGSSRLFGAAADIGRGIKEKIKKELDLVASIGISYNKFFAKLASDLNKPDGFLLIDRVSFAAVVHPLPVKRLWGVGRRTEEKLRALGINTIGDVAQSSPAMLRQQFGTVGEHIYLLSKGIDERAVVPDHEAKSVGRETTFPSDVNDAELLLAVLMQLAEDVCYRLRTSGVKGSCVTLKIRYDDFETHTRQVTLSTPTNLEEAVFAQAKKLFAEVYQGRRVRLLGVSVSHLLQGETAQMSLFEEDAEKGAALALASDRLRKKYGRPLVVRARSMKQEAGD